MLLYPACFSDMGEWWKGAVRMAAALCVCYLASLTEKSKRLHRCSTDGMSRPLNNVQERR